jgi:endo-1,3(4)-beta-glucanase
MSHAYPLQKLFENKVDHTTYFGALPEYIQGIHMIPINPISAYIRQPTYVQEEWDTYFANRNPYDIDNGWRGIVMADLAIIDPTTSWNFFNNATFDYTTLDGGASLTWYLAYAAGLAGA